MSFAGELRRLRQAQGLSQEELAEAIGVDRTTIAKLEAGGRRPRRKTARVLAQVLGVTLAELAASDEFAEENRPRRERRTSTATGCNDIPT